MEYVQLSGTDLKSSRIGLGTRGIGGWMWWGTDERESIRTIHAALDRGINLSDKSPDYGFGVSEEIVWKAILHHRKRGRVIIVTKVGLEWKGGKVKYSAILQNLVSIERLTIRLGD